MSDDVSCADTVEIPIVKDGREPVPAETGSARAQVDLAALTHQGLVRASNEDHFLVMRFGRLLETLLTSLPADQVPSRSEEVGYALLVADGIGGSAAGEVASRVAIRTLISLVLQTRDWIMSDAPDELEEVLRRFAERFRRIQTTLRHQGNADPALAGMGTTMTLASSVGTSLLIGHIGDSRAYVFHEGSLCQLTRDHTLVQSLIDQGQLTEDQAATHPWRHVLTRSLSAGGRTFEGDFQRGQLADGDQLLLCTDGLTNMVDEATIGSILSGAASSDEACRALVAAALQNGGKDNITVALARYRFPH